MVRKSILPIISFILTGATLVYTTISLILGLRGINDLEVMGWLNITGVGVATGFFGLLLLATVFFLAVLWLLLLLSWLVRIWTHAKSDDGALHLP